MEITDKQAELLIADQAQFVQDRYTGADPNQLAELQDEYLVVLNELANLNDDRLRRSHDITSYDLPFKQGDLDRRQVDFDTFSRIELYEKGLATPSGKLSGYDNGSARQPDGLYIVDGDSPVILSAEHATTQVRRKPGEADFRKEADTGTAGLAGLLQKNLGTTLIVATGQQTGDANFDAEHPLKDELGDLIAANLPRVFMSLHGMWAGKFEKFDDERAFDLFVGIGDDPNEESEAFAENIVAIAEEFDLRAGINQRFVSLHQPGSPLMPKRRRADGQIAFNRFAASKPETTRAYAQAVAQQEGLDIAAVQVELSPLLRWTPVEMGIDPRTRQLGSYVGYCLIERSLKPFTKPPDLF